MSQGNINELSRVNVILRICQRRCHHYRCPIPIQNYLKKYLELFEERYEEPQEIVILGTFHVSLPKQLDTTTTLTNRSSATARKLGPSKTSATIVAKNK